MQLVLIIIYTNSDILGTPVVLNLVDCVCILVPFNSNLLVYSISTNVDDLHKIDTIYLCGMTGTLKQFDRYAFELSNQFYVYVYAYVVLIWFWIFSDGNQCEMWLEVKLWSMMLDKIKFVSPWKNIPLSNCWCQCHTSKQKWREILSLIDFKSTID